MRNLKKVLALIVAIVMAMSLAMTASASAVFPDVDSSDDYAQSISLLKALGVVGGDDLGNFNPTSTVTRAEFSKILFGLMNGSSDASLFVGPSIFTDVTEDSWYNGYINWASNLNIVNGKGDNKFAPKDSVTVQEATKMFIVALTGKSTLAWPYGFIAEAKKTNIDLFDGIDSMDAAKAAPRNLIAQLCKNAIFATDVAQFYVYNGDGSIASRPSAATAIFNLKSISSVIYETSFENYTISGISAVDQMTVMNESGALVKVTYSSDVIGNYTGYRGTVYYKDNTLGTANLLDTKDTIFNVVLDDCTVANALPLNVVSVSSTYQIQGITFDPTTDFDTNGKFIIMNGNGAVVNTYTGQGTNVYNSLATAYADASTSIGMKAILGAFTTSSTATYGPAQDYNVKIVKDIVTGKITAMYVVKNNPFAKVTTYSADAGILAVNIADAFKPAAATTAPSVLLASQGTAPNKTAVTVNGTFDTGDYVSIVPSRDFNGITYTVSPLLVNPNATFTGIKSDGSAMFGDITYAKNALVDTAVTAGQVPSSVDVLTAANLGLKMNVYLDATSKNYVYAELVSATTSSNYVFVKDIATTTSMGANTYTLTTVNAANETKSYTLATGCVSATYLDATNANATSLGWKVSGGVAKTNAVIYHRVVKLTLDSDGNVSKIDPLTTGNTLATAVKFDTDFDTLSVNDSVVATVNASTVGFFYDTTGATSVLRIYTGTTLPGFTGASAYYTTENTLGVKVIDFTNMGSALTSNVQYGAVSDYYAMAGTTTGKVRYDITAVVGGSLTAEVITTDEDPAVHAMGDLLYAAKTYKKFVGFNFSSDGDTVIGLTTPTVAASTPMTDGTTTGLKVGVVTLASNGLYAIAGVDFPTNGTAVVDGAAKYFSTNDATNVYLVPNTATAFADGKAALTPMGKTPTLGVAGNLIPITNEVRYVVVFNSTATNVLKDVFIFQAVNVRPAIAAPVLTVVATDTSAVLTWPAVTGATSYTVSYKLATDTTWTDATPVTVLTWTSPALTADVSYDYKVVANYTFAGADEAFSSLPSTTVSTTTVVAPTAFAAVATANKVALTWTATTSAKATGYSVSYKKAADTDVAANWTTVAVAGKATAALDVTGLLNCTTYNFKIVAVGANSKSLAVTVDASTPIANTTGLAVSAVGDATVTLTWTAVTDATSYGIAVSADGGTTYAADVVATGTTKVLTGLTNGTAYLFKIRTLGSPATYTSAAYSATVTSTPIASATQPTGLALGTTTAHQLDITWTANPTAQAITKYVVSVTINGVETSYNVTTNALTLTGLTTTSTYTVKVKAINTISESAFCTGVSAQIS